MTTLEQRIERVKELNAKRTQGEWDCLLGIVYLKDKVTHNICETFRHEADNWHDADSKFIASAPEMVSIIEALQQRVREREELIDNIRERITDVNYKTFPKGSTEYEDDTPGYIIGIVELIDEAAEHKE